MNGSEGNSSRQFEVSRGLRLGDVTVFVFALAAFLPYLKSSPFGSDVQPHFYVILPFVFLFFFRFNPAKTLHSIYCLLLIGIGAYLKMGGVELLALTAVCLTVNVLAGMDDQQQRIICWAVRLAMVLYLLAAFVDLAGGAGLLDKVVANRRRSAARGLCSLASEPSFLGFVGLAGFVVLRKHANLQFRVFDAVVPFLVIFCSGSAAAVTPALLVVFAGSLRSIRAVAISTVSMVVLLALAFTLFPNSRFVDLAKRFETSPAEVLEESSGANRVFRGLGPTYYAFKTGLMPHSPDELDQIYRKMKFLREDVRITRISNLGGMMFFVFGVLSLPLIVGYALQFRGSKINEIAFAVAVVVVFSFSLVTASNPYMHFVLGTLLWRSRSLADQGDTDEGSSLSTQLE